MFDAQVIRLKIRPRVDHSQIKMEAISTELMTVDSLMKAVFANIFETPYYDVLFLNELCSNIGSDKNGFALPFRYT